MEDTAHRAIAIVGVGAIMPDAPSAPKFWENIKGGRSSVTEVTPDRWNPAFYYDPDPAAPDKSYSKIGGWVREYPWEPMKWKLPIPPRVAEAMDEAQKWAIACTREALEDYGYPKRALESERTAVILGSAIAGERQYFTVLRAYFPEYAQVLGETESFAALPEKLRVEITRELHARVDKRFPQITEDTMPGELANCIAGRIANLFNFRGPNFVTDAACASAMAALHAAYDGLIERDFDAAICGGIDRNMGPSTYIKFCKIGALSATGTRPYAEGADGFVMGEGAAVFLLKRLADAERDGDSIYGVLRGMAGSSDGKGKGITAPNPVGQKIAIERAWQNAGLPPETVSYIEGHGTSTKVGDAVELESMAGVLSNSNLPAGAVAIGSVKSNLGHLKAAAGAAGVLKTVFALRDKVLPPSVNCERPSAGFDFAHAPIRVNRELNEWKPRVPGEPRRAAVSAFGFGGTNFHAVFEEYIPHRLNGNGKKSVAVGDVPQSTSSAAINAAQATGVVASDLASCVSRNVSPISSTNSGARLPMRGALVLGGVNEAEITARLRSVQAAALAGQAPAPAAPALADLRAPERIAIDYADAADLANKTTKALKAFESAKPGAWKALRSQGIFRGRGAAPKAAFLYTGQGSQYVNMLKPLRAAEPMVAEIFAEADRVSAPLLGKPLSEFIFVDQDDKEAIAKAEEDLRQTAITQPAVLTSETALTRLLAAYGVEPDMTMGHSLGEYGALVAAGALPFAEALEAVSARGREMTRVAMDDNGGMAAVNAPLEDIERILKTIDGYIVVANINSRTQSVIGGRSDAVEQAMKAFRDAGIGAVKLNVSHAFHTSIVAPAGGAMRQMLVRLHLQSARVPVIANVTGDFYPRGENVVPQMIDLLARQVASPVQFVKGLETLYGAGARLFVEIGPKKALQGFVDDVFSGHDEVASLFTNHPKTGDVAAFNQALCGFYAAGLGRARDEVREPVSAGDQRDERPVTPALEPVAITGAALGLPGTERIFADENIARILRGDQFIDLIPAQFRRAMLDKNITRLVKSENGGPTFETISDVADVIKLAGRGGKFDLGQEYGVPRERIAALDRATALAIASGIDAMRDAGIPLVMRYKTTTKGTQLPDRWMLPEPMRDTTGVVFASAFPGFNAFEDEMARYFADHNRREQLAAFEDLRSRSSNGLGPELDGRIAELRAAIDKEPYCFDRRFLFRVLSMGHSQFAEYIGARGPNTQVNSACASTTLAIALAEDWIRAGRCRRVIVISADDVTYDNMMEWIGAGFLASGAAATDDVVTEAALPFDRRRHGMIIGMGGAALVVESAEAARERGIRPICEVLSAEVANSAFHGTRLDVNHIGDVMERLVARAENSAGIQREQIAPHTVFVSHETYTPARGGSASAEIFALRRVFGAAADQIVIANTKGFTGHPMATGIEDVVAVKALETGCVPPVPNFKEVDPELGSLNLSKGGAYPVEYALRLAAGFGSQISMALLRWVRTKDGARPAATALGYHTRIADPLAWKAWLAAMTGTPAPELEVAQRTLRVRDARVSARLADAAHEAKPQPAPAPAPVVKAAAVLAKPVAAPAKPAPVAALGPIAVAAPAKVAPAATLAPAATPKPAAAGDVKAVVLAVVAEKTGYPVDMLDLDLDLEADLGVDTVKQAEVFAAVREQYGIARDESIKLRDFPTLAHVIRFVEERRPQTASAVAAAPAQPASKAAAVAAPAEIAAPAHSSSSAVPQPGDEEQMKERILALVVEKTGYPKDMLDLDLDMEADLGIDTVKQAELFAAVREIYHIPRDENRKLRDYPTLAHVLRFVREQRPDLGAAPAAPPQAVPDRPITRPADQPIAMPPLAAATGADGEDRVKAQVLKIAAEKTGYPDDMLDLDLDLEADLGVDTVKQAEMLAAIREIYNIPRDENRKLRDYPTLAHVIRFVHEQRPDLAAPAAEKQAPAIAVDSAPPVVVAALASPAGIDDEAIKQSVLDIVAEKTGYPKEMLDLDLDLEADLGIDTVKQAEMFAAVRAAYNIPRDENMKLRDFPTLTHVIRFAQERRPAVAGAVSAQPPAQPAPRRAKPAQPRVLASFDAAERIPRRVPVPVVRPPLDMCKPTGVVLGKGQRVIVMPDNTGVADALEARLKSAGVDILRLDPAQSADALAATLQKWIAAGAVHGVYWLAALDDESPLDKMAVESWREALRVRVKSLYTAMRTLYEQVAPAGTFLISATRLGGQHGYDHAGATRPLGGAVTGFTKTYKRERPEATVKAVDFALGAGTAEIAGVLVAETQRDPGAVEVGYQRGLRWSVSLREQSVADGQPSMTLDANTVFVVTGAAGSIVSAITADLAAASGGTFYLLDLVPAPDVANPDLTRLSTDKDGLKRDIFARLQAGGKRATPAMVEKELAALERAVAAQAAIDAVRAAGGTAQYFSVNLTDAAAVAHIVEEIRKHSGRIDVLLHAAGIERSHFLPDKDPREFDLVFDVKADGWFNLLRAIGDMPLGATVAFSSIAGRFGNAGQTDYSSANDLLCKITSSFRSTRPATRGIAIDWTAWGGIGMATRGSIPKMMELAGIDMLPPEAGVPWIRRELTAGGTRGEVLVGQRLGVMLNEFDPAGGFAATPNSPASAVEISGPMVGSIASTGLYSGVAIETNLEPAMQPFLHDHQIDGTPVLPGVMGIEAFAEAASAIVPGWHVDAIEDIDFLAPFKFYRHEARAVFVDAVLRGDGDAVIADCRLAGRRTLPNHPEPQVTVHFTGHVRLTKEPVVGAVGARIAVPSEGAIEASDIYRVYFHGPAYQVIRRAWRDGERMVGEMARDLPSHHHPGERPLLAAPRMIELCFQTAGLWEIGNEGRMGLPLHVDRVRVYGAPGSNVGAVFAVVQPLSGGSFNAEVVDAAGQRYVELVGYRTVPFTSPTDASALKAIEAGVHGATLAHVG